MFRAIVKKRDNLSGDFIADIKIISGDFNEDKQQHTTSSIIVENLDEDVKLKDILGIYDDFGTFYFWGIIEKISDVNDDSDIKPLLKLKEIVLSQFESLFNDNFMLLAQTSTNQKSFYNTKTVSDVIDLYLTAKEFGFSSNKNSMSNTLTPIFSDFADADARKLYKGLVHTIADNDATTHVPYPIEKETINLSNYLYDIFTNYQRVIKPYFSKTSLPDPYVEVEYIEATGTQYIDTGVSAGDTDNQNKLRIECDAQFTRTDIEQMLFGTCYYSSTASNRRNIVTMITSDSQFGMLNGVQITAVRKMGVADTERHLFTLDQITRAYLLRNYNNYAQFSAIGSNWPTRNLLLFASYNSTVSGAPIYDFAHARLYKCQIFRNDILIRWFVPCYNRETGEVGLYDKVSNAFFTNQGTGEFIRSQKLTDNGLKIAIFNPKDEIINYDGENTWDYSQKTLFNTWEYIKNVEVVKEEIEFNTLYIYNSEGTTLRGAFTILEDGTIQQLTTEVSQPNRIGAGKSEYIFDGDNSVDNIVRSKMSEIQYNHKVTFDIIFNEKYSFNDFQLGQKIKFYRDNELFDSVLTARSYSMDENSNTIKTASFTLGKVRTNLTSKININKIQTKKK